MQQTEESVELENASGSTDFCHARHVTCVYMKGLCGAFKPFVHGDKGVIPLEDGTCSACGREVCDKCVEILWEIVNVTHECPNCGESLK